MKEITHMIISIDMKKTYDKIQHPVTVITLSKLGIEGNYLNIKNILENTKANIILNGEIIKVFFFF